MKRFSANLRNIAANWFTVRLLISRHGQICSILQRIFGGIRREQEVDLDFLRSHVRYEVSQEEANAMIEPITSSEIQKAIFDIEEDNTLGSDGFKPCFYKASWRIEDDVTKAIQEFFINGKLLKQVNTTLIILIPKVQLPWAVADFRPISCCNMLYKVISKIMVGRMMATIVDKNQNAFVPGRSIVDNVLLAQELLAGYNQKRLPPRCTIKIDLQKAYEVFTCRPQTIRFS
ncbi:UNVERIFIED_CONTAM: hypothetical protein Sradi_3340300 [Sesamum radiatum]|uniref:Reverse transcriptase domain-containing protein n=1 Tax=Sesamum radiatum TaxID=300843 RepID=A0AAW2R3J6_SESRA